MGDFYDEKEKENKISPPRKIFKIIPVLPFPLSKQGG
jgi:hypothetical protein